MLSNNQKMWVKSVASQFKQQPGITNALTYFDLSFLEDIPPEISKMNLYFYGEAKELFLKELGEKSSE